MKDVRGSRDVYRRLRTYWDRAFEGTTVLGDAQERRAQPMALVHSLRRVEPGRRLAPAGSARRLDHWIEGAPVSSILTRGGILTAELTEGVGWICCYQVVVPDVAGTGAPSTGQMYTDALRGMDLEVVGCGDALSDASSVGGRKDRSQRKRTARRSERFPVVSVRHRALGMDPFEFSRRTIACLYLVLRAVDRRTSRAPARRDGRPPAPRADPIPLSPAESDDRCRCSFCVRQALGGGPDPVDDAVRARLGSVTGDLGDKVQGWSRPEEDSGAEAAWRGRRQSSSNVYPL